MSYTNEYVDICCVPTWMRQDDFDARLEAMAPEQRASFVAACERFDRVARTGAVIVAETPELMAVAEALRRPGEAEPPTLLYPGSFSQAARPGGFARFLAAEAGASYRCLREGG